MTSTSEYLGVPRGTSGTSAANVAERRGTWLFSRNVDLAVFGGSALVSLAAIAIGARLGILHGDTPPWVWLVSVLFIDVAHVHATLFRTYFDAEELRRRPLLYTAAPVAALVIGVALYDVSVLAFWRAIAYLATFHFVRQQYGWVALYRRKAGERDGWWLDAAAIYAATLYPLVWWHAHLPRNFWWLVPHDFAVRLPTFVADVAQPLYWTILAAYAVRSIARGVPNPGKDLVVLTTAVCWHLGIITLNSDYAFTVTNVVIHGVPYFALIYMHGRAHASPQSVAKRLLRYGPFALLGVVWLLAFVEEMVWDHAAWHEHARFFGAGGALDGAAWILVPLLAMPQITHYVLDGFIWRRGATATSDHTVIPSEARDPVAG